MNKTSDMKTCETCKHYKKDSKPTDGWFDRKLKTLERFPSMSDHEAATMANNSSIWPGEYNHMGWCENFQTDICEAIPDHMSCKNYEKEL